MGKINMSRVLLGGLLAGVVFNLLEAGFGLAVTGKQFDAALAALGRPMVPTTANTVLYLVLGFVTGIALVWLYAGLRPRFGPGPKTAVLAGLAAWVFMGLVHGVAWQPIGLFPTKLNLLITVQWLIELPLAAMAGGWVYREEA